MNRTTLELIRFLAFAQLGGSLQELLAFVDLCRYPPESLLLFFVVPV